MPATQKYSIFGFRTTFCTANSKRPTLAENKSKTELLDCKTQICKTPLSLAVLQLQN